MTHSRPFMVLVGVLVAMSAAAQEIIFTEDFENGTTLEWSRTEPDPGYNLQTAVAQWGVTWTFDEPSLVGTYANGDAWVLGPVTILSITPQRQYSGLNVGGGICSNTWFGEGYCRDWCHLNFTEDSGSHCTGPDPGYGDCICERIHHGWEVNPGTETQAFDDRAGRVDGTGVPALPYVAPPGSSIVKAVSWSPLEDRACSPSGSPCLSSVAILTVVGQVPPGDGASVLRPPYVGSEKPVYELSDFDLGMLPSLPPVVPMPTLDDVRGWFERVQFDHLPGNTARRTRPDLHMFPYAPDNGRIFGDGALRLMLDDPIEDKMPALISYLQAGLDFYHITREGQLWPPGGGEQAGSKLPIVFFAGLLNDPEVNEHVRNLKLYEDYHAHFNADGVALFGNLSWGREETVDALFELRYWQTLATHAGSRTRRDPYLLIDGGQEPGASYQFCCTSQPFKGAVLSLHLMPDLKALWNPDELIDYVDRWVNLGAWTQPDTCAPVDGRCVGGDNAGTLCTHANREVVCTGAGGYCDTSVFFDPDGNLGLENHFGVTYGPDAGNPGFCIQDLDPSDGIGRFPQLHGVNADSGHRYSAFQAAMWDAYRGSSCYDGVCDPGETCDSDCGGD